MIAVACNDQQLYIYRDAPVRNLVLGFRFHLRERGLHSPTTTEAPQSRPPNGERWPHWVHFQRGFACLPVHQTSLMTVGRRFGARRFLQSEMMYCLGSMLVVNFACSA